MLTQDLENVQVSGFIFCSSYLYNLSDEVILHLQTGMWIELAEAQLNYAFGQTDTLLEALDVPPSNTVQQQSIAHKVLSLT